MKKTFLFTLLTAAVCAQAQVNIDNFENSGNTWSGVETEWAVVVPNAYKEGINLSDKVLMISRSITDVNYVGAILNPCVHSGYKYLHAYMWRNNANKPNLKVSDSNPLDLEPMNPVVPAQWQDVVFDLSAYEQSGTEFIFFMVDRTDAQTWDYEPVMFVDEVQLSNDPTPRTAVVGGAGTYQLVWNEDFTEASLDTDVWNIEVNGDGGGNNELQYYCEKGVSVGVEPSTGKHCLILTATKENYNGRDCTSGRVNSKNKMYYTFGKIEARIKFPNTANGLWPAFWQMGNNYDQVGWPRCGETDIIEIGHQNAFATNKQDRYFNGAMHVGSDWQHVWSEANNVVWPYSVEDTFHIVTMIWTPTTIDMYMDLDSHPAEAYFHADLEPNENPAYDRSLIFGKPNFLIANLAVGGDFPGIYTINGITALADGPRTMYIDWIRIYQRGESGESFQALSPSDPIEPEMNVAVELVQQDPQDISRKMLYDGQLFIRRGGHVYTVTGIMIR